jgi:hypothetical protein
MNQARALRFGLTAAALAVAVALIGLWFFLFALGFFSRSDAAHAFLPAPAVLLAIGTVVLAAVVLAPDSMALVASVEGAAAVAGLANLALLDASSGWSGPVAIMFAVPPALLLIATACAVAALPSSMRDRRSRGDRRRAEWAVLDSNQRPWD